MDLKNTKANCRNNYLFSKKNNFRIELCEIKSKQADVQEIIRILGEKSQDSRMNIENLKYFNADGAATNGAVPKLTYFKIQKCHYYVIH